MTKHVLLQSLIIIVCSSAIFASTGKDINVIGPYQKLTPIGLRDVTLADGFWASRVRTNIEHTLPHVYEQIEKSGAIRNFINLAEDNGKGYEGRYPFFDYYVYKWIEAACLTMITEPDEKMLNKVDELITYIGKAQDSSGYIHTFFQLKKKPQLTMVADELFAIGTLYEAAIAHYVLTGKNVFMDIAKKSADNIYDETIGKGRRCTNSHQGIEHALVQLGEVTGEKKYLDLAEYFIENRGTEFSEQPRITWNQNIVPVREFHEMTGHAVRGIYYVYGIAEVYAHTGEGGYKNSLEKLWANVVNQKMYITGGLGTRHAGENFGKNYELPNVTAYSETCATIGGILWAHKMLQITGRSECADVLEKMLYNAFLSGVSVDGKKFAYPNTLRDADVSSLAKGRWDKRISHDRFSWTGCACCPPNLIRVFPLVSKFIYSKSKDALYVNLYINSAAAIEIQGQQVRISQESNYPWDGNIKMKLNLDQPQELDLKLRIPEWVKDFSIKVNGKAVEVDGKVGVFCSIKRKWQDNDIIELDIPVEPMFVFCDPKVKENINQVAIQRGPVVYCIEQSDNPSTELFEVRVAGDNDSLSSRYEKDFLGGVTIVEFDAMKKIADKPDQDSKLYGYKEEVDNKSKNNVGNFERLENKVKAIPYYVRHNRGADKMTTWIPLLDWEKPFQELSASFTVDALDFPVWNEEPLSSRDRRHSMRLTFEPHTGTKEWLEYKLTENGERKKVSYCEVYWYDMNPPRGGSVVPQTWQVQWWNGDKWLPVKNTSEYPTERNTYNKVTFEPVFTSAIRLDIQLQQGRTGGILDWRTGL